MPTSNGIASRLNAVHSPLRTFFLPFYLLCGRCKSKEILKCPISFDPTRGPKPFHYFQLSLFIGTAAAGLKNDALKPTAAR